MHKKILCNQPYDRQQINPVVKWSTDICRLPNSMLNFRRIIKGISDCCPHGRYNLEKYLMQFGTKLNVNYTWNGTKVLAGNKGLSLESYFQETEEWHSFLHMKNLQNHFFEYTMF